MTAMMWIVESIHVSDYSYVSHVWWGPQSWDQCFYVPSEAYGSGQSELNEK